MAADIGSDSTSVTDAPVNPDPDNSKEEGAANRRGAAVWAVLAALLLLAIVLLILLTQCVPRIPDVVGLTRLQAEKKLAEAGYEVGETSFISQAKKPVGKVIAQAPEAGTIFGRGTPVDLIIIKGSELVRVPDVLGNDTPAAQLALKAKGLDMEPTGAFSDVVPEGAIISQEPAPGTLVKVDSAVAVVVSLGPSGNVPAGSSTSGSGSVASVGSGGTGTGSSGSSSNCTRAYPGASVWSSGGNIYARLTPGGGTRQLTSGSPWDTKPLLAPSAKYVVFMRAPSSGSKPNKVGVVCLTDFGVSILSLPVPDFASNGVWYTEYIFAPSPTGTSPNSDWLITGQMFSPDPNYNGGPGGRLLVTKVPIDSTWVSWNNAFRPTQTLTFSRGTAAGSVRVHSTIVKNANFFPYTGVYRW